MKFFSACNCDATGSSSLQCADTTGLCTCNAGYKGNKCDTACGCDTTGSSSTSCDQTTGQCTCNTGYTGTTCNSCDTNYYKTGVGTTCAGQYSKCLATFSNFAMAVTTWQIRLWYILVEKGLKFFEVSLTNLS